MGDTVTEGDDCCGDKPLFFFISAVIISAVIIADVKTLLLETLTSRCDSCDMNHT